MSINTRFLSYALLVSKGRVRSSQLGNLLCTKLMPKREYIRWQPTHLSIFVTNRCSFHCDMCPTHSRHVPLDYPNRHRNARDMTPKLLRRILERYPAALRVELIGTGEPLLNPDLYELIAVCVDRGMIVDTVSNGLALDSHARRLVSSGLDRVCVSVNGHTPEEFHRMTGMPEKCHPRIVRNVEQLVHERDNKRSPRIEVSFIVDQYNYHNMEEMIIVGERLGADGVNFYNFLPTQYVGYTAEERCLYADSDRVIEELTRLTSKRFACSVTWPSLLERFSRSQEIRQPCRWPFTLLQVDGDGNVGGCPSMMLGMQDNGSVTDPRVWNNQYFRNLRRRHLNGEPMGPCKRCAECMGVSSFAAIRAHC